MIISGRGRAHHVTEGDHLLVGVGDLDADGRLARDGREDPDVGAGDGVGDVPAEGGHLLHLHGRSELDLVARHRRAPAVAGHRRIDLELLEHAGQPMDDGVGGLGPGPVHTALAERPGVGQQVLHVAGELQLLDPLRYRGVRRRLEILTAHHHPGRQTRGDRIVARAGRRVDRFRGRRLVGLRVGRRTAWLLRLLLPRLSPGRPGSRTPRRSRTPARVPARSAPFGGRADQAQHLADATRHLVQRECRSPPATPNISSRTSSGAAT